MSQQADARRYRTIVCDPPWEYRQKWAKSFPGASMFKTGGGASRKYAAGIRGAASHYDCMTVDAIKALPLGEWADDGGGHCDCSFMLLRLLFEC